MKLASVCLVISGLTAAAVAAVPALPEGNTGIAARYAGDSAIASDPAVIFADGFEGYSVPNDLWGTYYNVFQLNRIRFAQEPGHVYSGSKSLEFTMPRGTTELSNGVQMQVNPQRDVLFLRYYSKFDTSFDITGSCHNGGGISAHYYSGYNATPGVPADGYNKYLIEFECWRGDTQAANPGQYNVYIYHPLQRDNYGDHFFPNGEVMPNTSLPFDFGPDFEHRAQVIPELGRWYCHEVMLQANTVGLKDGRIGCWLDGVLIADFQNLELRKVDSLKIDRFNVSFHARSNPVRETRKWYDNIVAATSYIGPTVREGSVRQPRSRPAWRGPAAYAVCNTKGQVVGRMTSECCGGAVRPGRTGGCLPRGVSLLWADNRADGQVAERAITW